MVSGFRRSISFPNQNPRPSEKSFHVRSTSLPCRSHPVISHLKDELNELRTWESKAVKPTSAWICDGLSLLKSLQETLDDLLQLPQTRESLRQRSIWVEKLLEDFLRFADVYGIFRSALLALKEEQSAAQVALRRRDESNMASYIKARKKMDKEIVKLVSAIRCTGRCTAPRLVLSMTTDDDAEISGVLRDVNEVMTSASIALFNGLITGWSSRSPKYSWLGWSTLSKKGRSIGGIEEFREVGVDSLSGLKKKAEEELRKTSRKLQTLEDCVSEIENGSERVFRSLINTRVSLLNILTL